MIQQARGDAEEILAEARRVADSQRERMKEELEAERQRRLEDTAKQIEAETRRALEQIRGEVAELTVIATSKVTGKVLDGRGSPPPDRRGDRRPRLLGPRGERRATNGRRPAHLRQRALRGRARRRATSTRSGRSSHEFLGRRGRRCPSCARCSRTRRSTRTSRSRRCARSSADADELVRNFLLLIVEKGRTHELPVIVAGVRDARRARGGDPRRRAHDRRRALRRRRRARSSSGSRASPDRKLRATRRVDPNLIGGFVLQAGSHRVDASVRGPPRHPPPSADRNRKELAQ